MKWKSSVSIGMFVFITLSCARSTSAQTPIDRNGVLKKLADNAERLPPAVRQHLSAGMQAFLRDAAAKAGGTASQASALAGTNKLVASNKQAASSASPKTAGLVPVSDETLPPAQDVENTSSSAWCGDTIVVGFQDTGAAGFARDNVSISDDRGKSFHDLAFSGAISSLFGDPVVTCSSPSDFQYTGLMTTTEPNGLIHIGPGFSKSADGGKTWSDPLQAAFEDGFTAFVDKAWLAVDPNDPQRLYLTYSVFYEPAFSSVRLVSSADGGMTWSAAIEIASNGPDCQCTLVTGSNIAVGPNGDVYVTYEVIPLLVDPGVMNSIYFSRSTDHGQTFSTPTKISDVVLGGDGVYLNGHIQVNDNPRIAVDRSSTSSRGTIYVTWPDGRDRVVPDPGTNLGTYSYPDIFLAKSTDGGQSFTVLGAISPTPSNFQGVGRDQFLPSVAVNKDANVAVCYYDRRNDPADQLADRFCSVSADRGESWRDLQISHANWQPINLQPFDDYDLVTTDFLLNTGQFFGSLIIESGNTAAVFAKKF